MENLKKKTFFTIFIIISLFAFIFAIFFNVQTYHREYTGILNNLTRIKNLTMERREPFDKEIKPISDEELRNRKFMDYEVYTFILNGNNIVDKISHSDNDISDEIITKAQSIISSNSSSKIKIGCLYLSKYAYNYEEGNSLTIVNISDTRSMLLTNLIFSLLLIGFGEVIIYFISKYCMIRRGRP